MSGIHHFVPVLHRGDAVGRHTLRLRDATRARGYDSHIYVDTLDADTANETLPVLSYAEAAQPGDVVVYQFATASAMAPWLAGRSETLVVNYHNITPPDLMAPWDNHLALGQLQAQGDLALLAPRAALAVADSIYNEAHLAGAGFAKTAVVPPSAALDALGALGALDSSDALDVRDPPQPTASQWRRRPGATWSQVARRRPGVTEQGPREHRRRAGRGAGAPGSRRDASRRRQARHRVVRGSAAALRRRHGTGGSRALHGTCE